MEEQIRKCLSGLVGQQSHAHGGRFYVVFQGKCLDGLYDDEDDAHEALSEMKVKAIMAIFATKNEDMIESLKEAVAVGRACTAFVDQQISRAFQGERTNWKSAALSVINEVADKPEHWEAAIK